MTDLLDTLASLDQRWLLIGMLGVLDAWAITLVWMADGSSRKEKTLWTGVILLCPIVGCILWFVFGPKRLPRARPTRTRPAGER